MKNVITLGKLIGLLLLFHLPLRLLLSIFFLTSNLLTCYTKDTRNELARLVRGTIVLVGNSFYGKKMLYTDCFVKYDGKPLQRT